MHGDNSLIRPRALSYNKYRVQACSLINAHVCSQVHAYVVLILTQSNYWVRESMYYV